MPAISSKQEIIQQLQVALNETLAYCNEINDEIFFHQPETKWSIAQDIAHLTTATNSSRLAYTLPRFIVRLYAGKPNRPSRSYDELVEKYKSKLEKGGKASGRFVPSPISPGKGKQLLLDNFSKAMDKMAAAIQNKWETNQLDKYIAPHPLLGKITLRELAYFNIYHTYHHLALIKQKTQH
ncbi:hypothetical protein CAP36_14645 [Chitinophagaceae bacterium IBVUCB2]|nr:hypothetical protein CAP36_14645 [Chitinophagaceae bacterium IBVUCB2]